MPSPKCVSIIAADGDAVAVALGSVLTQRGWSCSASAPLTLHPSVRRLVVLGTGHDHRFVVSRRSLSDTVVIGSVDNLAVLIRMAGRGARILNRDAPFVQLVHAVERLLNAPQVPDRAVAGTQVGTLEGYRRAAAAVDALTGAQSWVLNGLVVGLTAAELADAGCVSMHTIRSHVKAILWQLGVTSQVAATAVARRLGPRRQLPAWHGSITNFGDETAALRDRR